MDHLRRFLRVHREPLSGDEDDSRRFTINPDAKPRLKFWSLNEVSEPVRGNG
jgi:hypothetical protein